MLDKTKRFYPAFSGLLVVILVVVGLGVSMPQAKAQDDTNLLVNGSLELPYYGQGSSTRTVPQGWNMWVGAGAPDAFPHTDPVQILDGEVSWNVKQGYVAFTAAAYQTVSGLKEGDVLKLTASGWAYTCNDTEYSCIIEEAPYRKSDTSAGVSLKVGIDPSGGTNPGAESVTWSAVTAPYDQWAQMSITATAKGSSVTVFLYMSQAYGLAMNNVYWDNASLVRTEEGADEPVQQFAPFVAPQGVRQDGSIVHVVQAGDTLSSITYAYSKYGVSIEDIAALNESIKVNTRFLQLGQEIMILPPGSVDPVTGQLLPEGSSVPSTQATASAPVQSSSDNPPQASVTQPENPPATQAELAEPVEYVVVQTAFMPFERGFMFWVQDTNEIFVLTNVQSELAGTFAEYQDTWREGMPESDPNIQAPSGFEQPTRGFGQAWRTYPGVRDALGWGTGGTHGYTALVVRDQDDVLISGPDNRVYRLQDDGTWTAVDLYLPEDQIQSDQGQPDASSSQTAPPASPPN